MKYKILIINDKDLVKELESQAKQGFEIQQILDKINPNAQSDFVGWRILLVNKGKR